MNQEIKRWLYLLLFIVIVGAAVIIDELAYLLRDIV